MERLERLASARGHLEIPDVAQADQGEGPGEGAGPSGIPRPELPQDGDQRRTPQGVDLVDEEDERPSDRPRPGAQCGADSTAPDIAPRQGVVFSGYVWVGRDWGATV